MMIVIMFIIALSLLSPPRTATVNKKPASEKEIKAVISNIRLFENRNQSRCIFLNANAGFLFQIRWLSVMNFKTLKTETVWLCLCVAYHKNVTCLSGFRW